MKFLKLLDPRGVTAIGPGPTIAEQATAARELFPRLVNDSNLVYWHPGDRFANEGIRFLVGVAPTFSMADLRLMDIINELFESHPRTDVVVNVFDVDDIANGRLVSDYFPGCNDIASTPIVGVWKEGHLETVVCGAKAMNVLLRSFALAETAESLVRSVRPPASNILDG